MARTHDGKGIIYAIEIAGTPGMVKIGYTRLPLQSRLSDLQTAHHAQLHVVAYAEVEAQVQRVEKALHRILQTTYQRGEWFAMAINQHNFDALILLAIKEAAQIYRIEYDHFSGQVYACGSRPRVTSSLEMLRVQGYLEWHGSCKAHEQEESRMQACCRCAAPSPHEHGPCRLCAFYTDRRPGDATWVRRPTCLHPTMQEMRDTATGSHTIYGDITVRNGGERCPTFQRRR